MEVDDNQNVYELQEYDATYDNVATFQKQPQELRAHKKSSRDGRLQTVLQLIQLILLVILLIAAAAILYRLYTSEIGDCSPAPFIGSTNKVLTDLANTSTDTQSAVKEVSQIILAEIQRRLNDTATLNRLAKTTDVSSQSISDALNAIFAVNNLANKTNGAVDTSAQRILTAIFDVDNLVNATNGAVDSSAQKILADIANLANATNDAVDSSAQLLLRAIFNVNNVANATSSAVESNNEKLTSLISLTESLILKIGSNYEEEKEHLFNNTELLNRLFNGTSASAAKLINIVNTLSKLEGTGTSTAGVADAILLIVVELLELHNETAALPTSCQKLKEQRPNSPNGYYILEGTNGTYSAYCNMGTLCGSPGGGWTRLAYLNMSDAAQSCPSAFRLYQSGSVRACGRPVTNSASCVSVTFPSNDISYSQICGRVVGYQYGGPDAARSSENLNSYYVDGVSITRGSPRKHVWTLMADNGHHHCPCNIYNSNPPQSFIGNHYFCEAETTNCCFYSFHTSDPLWDGQGCDSSETPCCNAPGIPWFHRDYGNSTTTDYIEMRICGDDVTSDEDAPVSFYEIYVR